MFGALLGGLGSLGSSLGLGALGTNVLGNALLGAGIGQLTGGDTESTLMGAAGGGMMGGLGQGLNFDNMIKNNAATNAAISGITNGTADLGSALTNGSPIYSDPMISGASPMMGPTNTNAAISSIANGSNNLGQSFLQSTPNAITSPSTTGLGSGLSDWWGGLDGTTQAGLLTKVPELAMTYKNQKAGQDIEKQKMGIYADAAKREEDRVNRWRESGLTA